MYAPVILTPSLLKKSMKSFSFIWNYGRCDYPTQQHQRLSQRRSTTHFNMIVSNSDSNIKIDYHDINHHRRCRCRRHGHNRYINSTTKTERHQSCAFGTTGSSKENDVFVSKTASASTQNRRYSDRQAVNADDNTSTSRCTVTTGSSRSSNKSDDRFIQQVEGTIQNVVRHYHTTYGINVLDTSTTTTMDFRIIPPSDREVLNIVRYLHDRIQSMKERNICRRCWFPTTTCICAHLVPHTLPNYIHSIYILTHYKEIGMMIDTMKLLLCTYPNVCQLVIGGIISNSHQLSMDQMIHTLSQNKSNTKTLVLFPSSNAITFPVYYRQCQQQRETQPHDGVMVDINHHVNDPIIVDPISSSSSSSDTVSYNIIVIDATWEQARRLYNRHINVPTTTTTTTNNNNNNTSTKHYHYTNIQLSNESLQSLLRHEVPELTSITPSSFLPPSQQQQTQSQFIGQQIRPHPIQVREIATAHAVQLVLHDIITTVEQHRRPPPLPNNKNKDHHDTTNSNKFSLQLHYEQQQKFDQYQQVALDAAIAIKKQYGK